MKIFSSAIFLPVAYGTSSSMKIPMNFLKIWPDDGWDTATDDSTFKNVVFFTSKSHCKLLGMKKNQLPLVMLHNINKEIPF
jgi:hypothetical protein